LINDADKENNGLPPGVRLHERQWEGFSKRGEVIEIWIPRKPDNPTKLSKYVWDWDAMDWRETIFVKYIPYLDLDDEENARRFRP
jgi:hypothetical protein